ncbi:adenylate kinase [Nocardia sp. NPDC088792]|uniref:adenylate kinase n=1 Tax=Nocardia sp. NPDC088792 TaxID=3364332 RepID=UPI0037FBC09F
MRFLILGPNGSGKGTQAEMLKDELGVPHISTGEMLRAAVAAGTPAGVEAAPIMAAGGLVPDELMLRTLEERLGEPDAKDGWILDGYPRNVAQAHALDRLLGASDRAVDRVIVLEVPDEVILERCRVRFAAEHRPDDDPEIVRERLALFHNRTQPVIELYTGRGIVAAVDGVGEVNEVFGRILAGLPK